MLYIQTRSSIIERVIKNKDNLGPHTHNMTKNALYQLMKHSVKHKPLTLKCIWLQKKMFPWREWKKLAHAAREGMERKWGKTGKGREERKHWAAYWKCLLNIQTVRLFKYMTHSLTNVVHSSIHVYKSCFKCTENTSLLQDFVIYFNMKWISVSGVCVSFQ